MPVPAVRSQASVFLSSAVGVLVRSSLDAHTRATADSNPPSSSASTPGHQLRLPAVVALAAAYARYILTVSRDANAPLLSVLQMDPTFASRKYSSKQSAKLWDLVRPHKVLPALVARLTVALNTPQERTR